MPTEGGGVHQRQGKMYNRGEGVHQRHTRCTDPLDTYPLSPLTPSPTPGPEASSGSDCSGRYASYWNASLFPGYRESRDVIIAPTVVNLRFFQ